ncbi:hypothetical protein BZL41_18990 [Pseudomonas sp. PIC25]|uniref:hypothetical protein n=1 Tax=Pseudomonas sp. PIC25 TaxID=1958773 RepID=UPI000BAB76BF|nr:hypothetical protein [Pseudomonas sp. PIC25]PAU56727.1 hypothetical protein BZL41_18990 [Pseudomonas sp. PIC25]
MTKFFMTIVGVAFSSLAAASAVVETFSDWSVIHAKDSVDLIAITQNKAGGYLAFRCFVDTQKCVHVFSAGFECKVGAAVPVLVNTPASALSVQTSCASNSVEYELRVDDQSQIHEVLQQDGVIGFAFPINSGLFKVVRYSLEGASEAMGYVKKYTVEQAATEILL